MAKVPFFKIWTSIVQQSGPLTPVKNRGGGAIMADLNCVLKKQLHFMVLILLKTLEKFHTTFRTATPQSIQVPASCVSCLTTRK